MAGLGLIGAIGGIGNEMTRQATEEQKMAGLRDFESWKMGVLNDLKIQEEGRAETRTIAAEQRKIKNADQVRQDEASSINAEAGRIADTEVGKKRGLVQSGIADQEAWTPEQQAAVDQSLASERDAAAGDWRTREKAATSLGYISPEKAAGIERDQRRLDIADKTLEAKGKSDALKDERERYIADLRHEDAQARLEALLRKTGKDNSGIKEALSVIDGSRKDIANEATNLKSLYATELKDKSRAEQARIEATYKPKFEAIESKRAQLDADYDSLRSQIGLPTRKSITPASTPAPAAPAASGKARPPLSSFLK